MRSFGVCTGGAEHCVACAGPVRAPRSRTWTLSRVVQHGPAALACPARRAPIVGFSSHRRIDVGLRVQRRWHAPGCQTQASESHRRICEGAPAQRGHPGPVALSVVSQGPAAHRARRGGCGKSAVGLGGGHTWGRGMRKGCTWTGRCQPDTAATCWPPSRAWAVCGGGTAEPWAAGGAAAHHTRKLSSEPRKLV